MTGSYFQKKIILIVALVAFLAGGFFSSGVVEAQGNPRAANQPNQAQVNANVQAQKQQAANNAPARGQSDAVSKAETNVQKQRVEAAANSGKKEKQASVSGQNDKIWCLSALPPFISFSGCGARLAFLILQIASWVLWVSAILFNATINYTLNMATFIKDIPIVDVGWTVFRDVTNLMFIFIILYIAINTIIGNEGYGIKKLLGKVIVGAMLINFSLFFTQAMVDASNIVALQFYHKIVQDSKGANVTAGKASSNSDYDSGISAAFVNAMGLQQIYFIGKGSGTSADGVTSNSDSGNLSSTGLGLNAGNLILVGLGGTALVIITAFVFFAGTMMLLTRTVVLLFLMILSPVAFMGSILPALGKYTGDWWNKLFGNLLFAPVYMMLLYLVMNMITGSTFKKIGGDGGGNFASMFAGGDNWIPTIITFVVLIMLMLGCLVIASKLGIEGGKWAESTGKGLAGSLGMTLGGANLGMGIARGGLGMAGGALTSFGKPLASSNIGRVMGGAALLRGGQALKDVKVGGKSYKDDIKAKEDQISKEYEAIKDTNTNLVQGRFEDPDKFKARQAKADALEAKNQIRADARVGVTVDPRTGKVTKKSFGVPSIFGGTTARYNAQKKLSKNREGDVEKSLKKPYEKAIKEAREKLKGALHDQEHNPDDLNFGPPANQARIRKAREELKKAQNDLKNLFKSGGDGGGTPAV